MINRIRIWYLRDKLIREVRHSQALHYQMLLFGQSYERKVDFISLRLIIRGLKHRLPFNKEVLDTTKIRRSYCGKKIYMMQ